MAERERDEERLKENEGELSQNPADAGKHVEQGRILYWLGHYDDALAQYTKALELDPEQDVALRERGALYRERGTWALALKDWERLKQLQKADEDVYLGFIEFQAMRKSGNHQALLRCQEAIELYPRRPACYIQLAHHYTRSFPYSVNGPKRFLACEQALYLSADIESHPSSSGYCARAWALTYLNRFEEAAHVWDQAIALDLTNPDVYRGKARMCQLAGRETEALAFYEQALAIFEQKRRGYPCQLIDLVHEGDLFLSLGRYIEALEAYERACRMDSASARASFGRGEALFHLQRYEEAYSDYKRAIELEPLYEEARCAFETPLKTFLRYEGDLARTVLALQESPDEASLLVTRSNCLSKLKRYDEALRAAEHLLRHVPDSSEGHMARGEALIGLSHYAEAHAAFERAHHAHSLTVRSFSEQEKLRSRLTFASEIMEYDERLRQQPTDWECALKKISSLWGASCYDDARVAYHIACYAIQDDAKAYLELAKNSHYGKMDALYCCEQMIHLDSLNAEAYARRGSVFFDLQRYDEALSDCEQALELGAPSWLVAFTKDKLDALFNERKRVIGNLANASIAFLRRGGAAWNAWRATQDASTYDLSYLALSEQNLSQANLSGVNLDHSDLSRCDLSGAVVSKANLTAVNLQSASLNAVNAREIVAPNINLSYVNMSGIDLRKANLSQAKLNKGFSFLPDLERHRRVLSEEEYASPAVSDLREASLHKADLAEASLDYALLARADLREANLARTLLRYANLREANLSQASLIGAELAGADLSGALLQEADLGHADLRGANLVGANLSGANLYQTLLDDTIRRGVDLSQTISRDTHPPRRKVAPPSATDPMNPANVSTVEMRPGVLTTLMHCQAPGCAEVMKLELVVAGRPHEDDQYQITRMGSEKPASLICDYLPTYAQSWHPSGLAFERVALALRHGDIAMLRTLDDDYVPFYCWCCHGVYCFEHMRFEEVWDDFYPHPDYWRGTCPYGHPTFVDH
ncbi:tetratricopeptide repeat protein [Ktedonospora formicarum]|uniref:Tetratricopeptide repeat protein n=1 Tax=Ktedonospora formicarum TaxID=2778364 RepID=A0A8J3I3I3_9CHLR|nr:tetratricopeptide repeat protein [Ktedonospora formicarum]GHO46200.1 hypothetical protein KSX_43630 [Ktedonospora formicarum]